MEDGEYDMAALCDRAKGGGAGGGTLIRSPDL